MLRVQVIVFVVLAVAFLAAVTGLGEWGRALAHRAYQPLLVEAAAADLAALKFGQAEEDLDRAVCTSPAYHRVALDAAVECLKVMPELAQQLLERAESPGAPPEARLDAIRIHRQLGQYARALDVAVDEDASPWVTWQARWLRASCLQALGRWNTPEAAPPPLPAGYEKAPIVPEIRAAVAAAMPPAPCGDDAPYCQGVAAFAQGDLDTARARLDVAVARDAWPADAAYRLGRIDELRGDRAGALRWYGRALAVDGPPHAAAATAYVTLTLDR